MRFQIPEQRARKTERYLEQLPEEAREGMTKAGYLDLIERILAVYEEGEADPKRDLQTCSRVTSVLAVLIANGRAAERKEEFCERMTACCRAIPEAAHEQSLDFSVRELALAYSLLKEYDTDGVWHELLSSVKTEDYRYPDGEAHNINLYNLAGEAIRTAEGLCDSREYIDRCLRMQCAKTDADGRYPDGFPTSDNPALYDLAARSQLQWIEHWDCVPCAESLRSAGVFSLMTQSVCGQIPYGGRSSQYLFNETLFASVMEYEAAEQARLGNRKTAGAMRRAAFLAIGSVLPYAERNKHIRNAFSDPSVGCEGYGYYAKYMISAAAFLTGAVLFADEEITPVAAPCEIGGVLIESGPRFHQIFAVCGGYSLQIDTDADPCYDATGLGRVQFAGAPVSLGLSHPFAAQPHYSLPDGTEAFGCAIGPGWEDGEGGVQYLSDLRGLKHALSVEEETCERLRFTVTYTGNALKNCGGVMETYTVDEGGVRYCAKLLESEAKAIYARVPLLDDDGSGAVTATKKGGQFNVCSDGWRYRMTSSAAVSDAERIAANRGGRYRIVTLMRPETTIRFQLSFAAEE